VAAGDRALSLGLTRAELSEGLERMRGWPGVASARRTVDFLDVRSESAGESVSRVRIHEGALPPPIPQLVIVDDHGRFVARVDFGWPELKTIGEFDGKAKYGELLKPGQTSREAMIAEKRREDQLRDLGWQVVRGYGRTFIEAASSLTGFAGPSAAPPEPSHTPCPVAHPM
jgi:hypothetical protein